MRPSRILEVSRLKHESVIPPPFCHEWIQKLALINRPHFASLCSKENAQEPRVSDSICAREIVRTICCFLGSVWPSWSLDFFRTLPRRFTSSWRAQGLQMAQRRVLCDLCKVAQLGSSHSRLGTPSTLPHELSLHSPRPFFEFYRRRMHKRELIFRLFLLGGFESCVKIFCPSFQ